MKSEEEKAAAQAFIHVKGVKPNTVFYTCSERFYIQVGLQHVSSSQAVVTVNCLWRPAAKENVRETQIYQKASAFSKPFDNMVKALHYIISLWSEEKTHPKIYLKRLKAVHEGMLDFAYIVCDTDQDPIIVNLKHIINVIGISINCY